MGKSPYEHENLADDEVLADGAKRRIGMMMKDSVEREVIFVALADGSSLHRPGARHSVDRAGLDAKAKAYADSVVELTTAWQRKPVADAAGESRGAAEGDVCTVREGGVAEGSPGHLKMVGGKLTCVPDNKRSQDSASVPRTMTADAAQRIRDAAWEESVRADESAWRGPAR